MSFTTANPITTANPHDNLAAFLDDALRIINAMSPNPTDGQWLESITIDAAPYLREWDIAECFSWADWPQRETHFPRRTRQDTGIDCVAIRRSDGEPIAIQCKARQLDEHGHGPGISKTELDKFIGATDSPIWAERWLITNGDSPLSPNTNQEGQVKVINLHADLVAQQPAAPPPEPCPHCESNAAAAANAEPAANAARQTRQCMQDAAVADSVRILREHAQSNSGGLPVGQARGRIILPCGTGKTRISLRILEQLTPPGQLSIVMCPSIALVAQIRREYLQHAALPLRALAVCSDETAGYDPAKESSRNTAADPTLDNSNVSASEIKGKVTTDPAEIAAWIRQGAADPTRISVIFGTYQSGRRIADALAHTGATAQVLIADEAHRTAGLRRKRTAPGGAASDAEQRIRDFTLCHDQAAFPAAYRIYQTATPRIYNTRMVDSDHPGDWIVRTMDDETVFGVELYRKSYVEAVNNGWLADYRIIALAVNDPDAYQQANLLAAQTRSKGRQKLNTLHYLRGMAFALAMGGAAQAANPDSQPADPDSQSVGPDNQSANPDGSGNDSGNDSDGIAMSRRNDASVGSSGNPDNAGSVPIQSCIAFMNTVDKSRNMASDLQAPAVRQWLQRWLDRNRPGQTAAPYSLEHLDAKSNVAARDDAKRKLAQATPDHPHGIINVGIFGEGTDSPTLSAVAFLEARKSPIDVIQAVGRAMRTAPGKQMGYIICPIIIPPHADPETWLSVSNMDEGWSELGQILLALRAHDQRIEDNLGQLLQLYIPRPPEVERTIIAVAAAADRRIQYREHQGRPGEAERAVARVLDGKTSLSTEFSHLPTAPAGAAADTPVNINDNINSDANINAPPTATAAAGAGDTADDAGSPAIPPAYRQPAIIPPRQIRDAGELPPPRLDFTQIITGKRNYDGSRELRRDTVARAKPSPDGTPGPVDLAKSKAKGRDMINKGTGLRINDPETARRTRRAPADRAQDNALQMLLLTGLDQHGDAIKMNLLAKSGLTDNRVARDLNLLETGIKEAAHHLRNDGLQPTLDAHFGLDNLQDDKRKSQADGCTIAALLLMNAAMLHQRIANGRWLPGVHDLAAVKNRVNIVRDALRQWHAVIAHDFRPVMEPAVRAIEAIEDTGKLAGLERALRHIAAEAQRIAETYADMGADHAGPLFNRVMGNQASDGAFFTRPVAAAIAARLTLDACQDSPGNAPGAADWTSESVWRDHKILDPACGSGALLAALLTDMKRRAAAQGANPAQLAALQKLAVEDTLKGMDINPISLQLAASQLTAGNQDIHYRRMGLHLMPYGPQQDNPAHTPAGALELLGQQAIVPRPGALNLADDPIASQTVWQNPAPANTNDAILEDAVDAAQNARIVIMNPPFTNRTKMGEKFPATIQQSLRRRVDAMEQRLVHSDPELEDFVDKNSIGPLFTALADKCLPKDVGVMTMIEPTIALTGTSKQAKRKLLAKRYHIHTVLTCHQPSQINLSQNTSINESIIVAKRHNGPKPDTRFIHLDRMPVDDAEVDELHQCIADCDQGTLASGWGEVIRWPAERIAAADWTPAVWRSSELAVAAARFANDDNLKTINAAGLSPQATGRQLRGSYEPAAAGQLGSFPILKSKGADAQTSIQSRPDEYWIPKNYDDEIRIANGGVHPQVSNMLYKAGHLLITAGQDNSAGRLTATADDAKYVGNGWLPVTGMSAVEAKALAVFINSTPGRLQLMRHPGKKLAFPIYSAAEAANLRIPDVQNNARIRQILADCWEQTKAMPVPQFRDGECQVRRLWDAAVAQALDYDPQELTRLRQLLHQEPHVRGLGYGQYAAAPDVSAADRARFLELADQWENATILLSNSTQAAAHPAHRQIVSMGEPVVPLILERMRSQGGHWFHALGEITGAAPVPPSDRGDIAAMQQAWLDWGERNGLA